MYIVSTLEVHRSSLHANLQIHSQMSFHCSGTRVHNIKGQIQLQQIIYWDILFQSELPSLFITSLIT